ncbi:MAG: hypothetical protein GF307_10080 [candidate division Zixibacteria bacterium]|nr:hypothetical protein [candidate division Zixibacteria bacterium]
MDIFLIKSISLLILIVVGYYLFQKFIYLFYAEASRKSKEVELSLRFFREEKTGLYGVTVGAPFYNEKKHVHIKFDHNGLKIHFTPHETLLKVLRSILKGKHLVQVTYNGIYRPQARHLQEKRYQLWKRGVRILDGYLAYTPESIEDDSLKYGINDKIDYFYITSNEASDKHAEYIRKSNEWGRGGWESLYKSEREYFEAEGEIFSEYEITQFSHCRRSAITEFVDKYIYFCIEKLFKLNEKRIPDGFKIPRYDTIFADGEQFNEKLNTIKMYFEEDKFVLYRDEGKKYCLFTERVGMKKDTGMMEKIASYLLPEMVPRKAYSKGKLRKLGVKFLLTSAFLIGSWLLSSYFLFNTLEGGFNIPLFLISFFSSNLAVLSAGLSIYYLVLGVFGKGEFVRVVI